LDITLDSHSVTIFHDPRSATSRNTLGLIRNCGIEPTIIDYLRNPPTTLQLADLIRAAGIPVRAALRDRKLHHRDLDLGNPGLTDTQLLEAMTQHPMLIERSFVATSRGTRLCRASEQVLDILPRAQLGFFAKENGEIVIAADCKRVRVRLR
jgi:arsenate reductase (glutaredoxin)